MEVNTAIGILLVLLLLQVILVAIEIWNHTRICNNLMDQIKKEKYEKIHYQAEAKVWREKYLSAVLGRKNK